MWTSPKFHKESSFAYGFIIQTIEPTFVTNALSVDELLNWHLAMENEYNYLP
jgi:hypothetical protein